MKKKLRFIKLSLIYHLDLLHIKLMEFGFNVQYVFKNNKFPRKLSKKKLKEMRCDLKSLSKKQEA